MLGDCSLSGGEFRLLRDIPVSLLSRRTSNESKNRIDYMEEAFELAGYFGAHAIWCVADADTLVPMLAVQRRDHSRHLTRFEGPELRDAVNSARDRMEANLEARRCRGASLRSAT